LHKIKIQNEKNICPFSPGAGASQDQLVVGFGELIMKLMCLKNFQSIKEIQVQLFKEKKCVLSKGEMNIRIYIYIYIYI